jgi:tetratricopeptide (TPR) repeat protein
MAQASVGRNERCPCGSGKRYKDCHGALAAAGTMPWAEPTHTPSPAHLLQAAQQAQLSGNALEAAALYRRVLEADPTNFDAIHMLGVAEYQSGSYETAIALVRRATELRPDESKARSNLQTLQSLPLIEREICRDVLPRLLHRVDCTIDLIVLAASAPAVHLVVGALPPSAEPGLMRLVAALSGARLTLWVEPGTVAPVRDARTLDRVAGNQPEGGLLLLYGTSASNAGWIEGARASRVVLIVAEDDPCAVIDRLDELFGLGAEQPGLLCASRELAERLRLPTNAVVPAPEPALDPGS